MHEPPQTWMLDRVTWEAFDELRRQKSPVLLPTGSTEQHGPHLPLGTDALIAAGIASRIAAEHHLPVAPPIVYGAFSHPRSGGGDRRFPGMIGIRGTTLSQVVADLTGELFNHGFRRLVVVNGHFENHPFLYEGLETAIDNAGEHDVRCVLLNYWDLIRDEDMPMLFPEGFPGWEAEHAGVVETSLMEAMYPEMADSSKKQAGGSERTAAYDVLPAPRELIPPSGIGWSAEQASAEKGERLLDMLLPRIAALLQAEGVLPARRA
jgi:creatinine amidohydrolase